MKNYVPVTPKYALEDGIPLPPRIAPVSPGKPKGRKNLYPLANMKVSQSFFVPCSDVEYRSLENAIRSGGRRTGFTFTLRTVDGGWRVWREA